MAVFVRKFYNSPPFFRLAKGGAGVGACRVGQVGQVGQTHTRFTSAPFVPPNPVLHKIPLLAH